MGKRSNFKRRANDWYATPPAAVVPLLPHLTYGDSFIEPCAGDMSLAHALESEGMSCRWGGDIEPRHPDVRHADALSDDLSAWVAEVDYIITNPPWSRHLLHPMIERFSALRPTWLLFDADWLHTRQSAAFLPLLRVVVSVGRLKWIPGSKSTGKDNCCWYLFDAGSRCGPIFHGRMAA